MAAVYALAERVADLIKRRWAWKEVHAIHASWFLYMLSSSYVNVAICACLPVLGISKHQGCPEVVDAEATIGRGEVAA